MSEGSLASRLREALLLQRAADEAERMPADAREELRGALLLARQRAEAADTLWANGHAAEGLRLAAASFEETIAATGAIGAGVTEAAETATAEAEAATESGSKSDSETVPGSETETESVAETEAKTEAEAGAKAPPSSRVARIDATLGGAAAVLRARRLPADVLTDAAEVLAKLRDPLPELDENVSPTDAETFRKAMRVRRRIQDHLDPAAMTPREVKLKRAGRWATLAGTVIIVVGALYLLLRTPHEAIATASGYFANSPQYAPDKAIDDDEDTEWLLADGQTGWIEVRLSPPRSIQKIRLKNGHNRHFRDRAVEEYEVELFDSSGASVGSAEDEFERLSPQGEWAEHDLGGSDVTRIRVNVKSFHRSGPALAEIDWVE